MPKVGHINLTASFKVGQYYTRYVIKQGSRMICISQAGFTDFVKGVQLISGTPFAEYKHTFLLNAKPEGRGDLTDACPSTRAIDCFSRPTHAQANQNAASHLCQSGCLNIRHA